MKARRSLSRDRKEAKAPTSTTPQHHKERPRLGSAPASHQRRLEQRQKQIDFGYNTIGYQNYIAQIPRNSRQRKDPQTPEKNQDCSTRSWVGQIRRWRRQLHRWVQIIYFAWLTALQQDNHNSRNACSTEEFEFVTADGSDACLNSCEQVTVETWSLPDDTEISWDAVDEEAVAAFTAQVDAMKDDHHQIEAACVDLEIIDPENEQDAVLQCDQTLRSRVDAWFDANIPIMDVPRSQGQLVSAAQPLE